MIVDYQYFISKMIMGFDGGGKGGLVPMANDRHGAYYDTVTNVFITHPSKLGREWLK